MDATPALRLVCSIHDDLSCQLSRRPTRRPSAESWSLHLRALSGISVDSNTLNETGPMRTLIEAELISLYVLHDEAGLVFVIGR